MLPKSKPQIGREEIVDLLVSQGLWRDRNLSTAIVVGIRGYMLDSMGEWGKNDRGIYDDAIILLTPDSCQTFNGNTDPSRHKPSMAQLVSPQKVTYVLGYHGYNSKYGHQAFRQNSPVIVNRDGGEGSGDKLSDGTFTDRRRSRFWINLHRGGNTTTSSAGCQTLPPSQWGDFYSATKRAMSKYNNNKINYYLVSNPKVA
tara:strand:+ start:132 stop:731 length:600 start_codon:yes stop_codon:yes gene_type:complete